MLRTGTLAAIFILGSFVTSFTCFAQNSGADTFKSKCQPCHGADGLGNSPVGKALGVRPYNAPDVLKLSNTDLVAIIKNGKNKMPPFAGKLTDPQITDVVAYIHTLQK